MNKSLGALAIAQIISGELVKYSESKITGVQEAWSFRDMIPNPEALFITDPAIAAVTLDGQTITVWGSHGTHTEYTIRNGKYYRSGDDKPVDPSTLQGAEF